MKKNLSFLSLPLVVAWGAIFLYFFLVLHSLYLSGKFGFHDLTLLNGIFSNTVHGRGLFWLTHDGFSHFRLQFTPTLLLIVPFYRIFESQFLLLALGNIAFFFSLLVFLKLFEKIASRFPKREKIPGWVFKVLPWVFFLLMVSNRYSKNVLSSGHYEIFFLPLWAGFAYFLFENKGWLPTTLLFLLTVGLRSDASFFLFFQLLGLQFIPSWTMANPQAFKRKTRVFLVACLLYFLLLVSVVNPALGSVDNFTRWWGHLGKTPVEIIITVLTSPRMLLSAIWKGAFLDLNLSFFFLSLLHPFYFLFVNLGAIPNYLMVFPDRSSLFYYSSGVFLPALYLGSFLGMLKLLGSFGGRLKKGSRLYVAVFSIIALAQVVTWTDTNNGFRFKFYSAQEKDLYSQILQFLEKNPDVESVASDWGTVVYLPNSKEVRVLEQYSQADLVILPKEGRALLSGFPSYAEAKRAIQGDPRFREVLATERAAFLVKRK